MLKPQNMEMWKRQNKMEMLEMWNVYWFLIPFYVTMKDTVVSFDEDSKQKCENWT